MRWGRAVVSVCGEGFGGGGGGVCGGRGSFAHFQTPRQGGTRHWEEGREGGGVQADRQTPIFSFHLGHHTICWPPLLLELRFP